MENNQRTKESQEKKWSESFGFISVLALTMIIFLSIVFGNNSTNTTSPTASSTPTTDPDMLNGTLAENGTSFIIHNNESADWTNCMFGVNGSTGFGFENPPYQTRGQGGFSVFANDQAIVPFSEVTLTDGTEFDSSTHSVNTFVLACFRGTTSERFMLGGD